MEGFEHLELFQSPDLFLLVGYLWDGAHCRVLRISRGHSDSLAVLEDPKLYTLAGLSDLLAGRMGRGDMQLLCRAFGVIGCFRFLEGPYLLLVTERTYLGNICGHKVYGVGDVAPISILHSSLRSEKFRSSRAGSAEKRYCRLLLSGVDLSKDFFFSYTYNLCNTLQTNLKLPGDFSPWNSMFVWNEYMTRDLRNKVSGRWLLPLVHGFFQQRSLVVAGNTVKLTVLARRSRHFAGTRYRKRGVNDAGQVANDVETEQLVEAWQPWQGSPPPVSSMAQVRGSIPLYWQQEVTSISPKPEIHIQMHDPLYSASKLHFDDLAARFGLPTVVVNLVKSHERRPREARLGAEFAKAVAFINAAARTGATIPPPTGPVREHAVAEARRAEALHVDTALQPRPLHAASNAAGSESVLRVVEGSRVRVFGESDPPGTPPQPQSAPQTASQAPTQSLQESASGLSSVYESATSRIGTSESTSRGGMVESSSHAPPAPDESPASVAGACGARSDPITYIAFDLSKRARTRGGNILEEVSDAVRAHADAVGAFVHRPARRRALGPEKGPHLTIQTGVLRTNCIDCLDRTNVVQFVYGLMVLGHQLHALQLTDSPVVDPDSSLAAAFMGMYEAAGHTLALQYGGSEAHTAFFQRQRGRAWETALQSKAIVTSIRRFYSNAVTDAEKQDAINLFLGHFVPQPGQLEDIWDLDSDYYLHSRPGPGPAGPSNPGPTGPAGPSNTSSGPASGPGPTTSQCNANQGPIKSPRNTDSGPTGPWSSNPGPTGPLSSNPGPTGPLSSNPGPTGPLSSNPGPTGPLSSNPGPTSQSHMNLGPAGPSNGPALGGMSLEALSRCLEELCAAASKNDAPDAAARNSVDDTHRGGRGESGHGSSDHAWGFGLLFRGMPDPTRPAPAPTATPLQSFDKMLADDRHRAQPVEQYSVRRGRLGWGSVLQAFGYGSGPVLSEGGRDLSEPRQPRTTSVDKGAGDRPVDGSTGEDPPLSPRSLLSSEHPMSPRSHGRSALSGGLSPRHARSAGALSPRAGDDDGPIRAFHPFEALMEGHHTECAALHSPDDPTMPFSPGASLAAFSDVPYSAEPVEVPHAHDSCRRSEGTPSARHSLEAVGSPDAAGARTRWIAAPLEPLTAAVSYVMSPMRLTIDNVKAEPPPAPEAAERTSDGGDGKEGCSNKVPSACTVGLDNSIAMWWDGCRGESPDWWSDAQTARDMYSAHATNVAAAATCPDLHVRLTASYTAMVSEALSPA